MSAGPMVHIDKLRLATIQAIRETVAQIRADMEEGYSVEWCLDAHDKMADELEKKWREE